MLMTPKLDRNEHLEAFELGMIVPVIILFPERRLPATASRIPSMLLLGGAQIKAVI